MARCTVQIFSNVDMNSVANCSISFCSSTMEFAISTGSNNKASCLSINKSDDDDCAKL